MELQLEILNIDELDRSRSQESGENDWENTLARWMSQLCLKPVVSIFYGTKKSLLIGPFNRDM